MLNTFAKKQQNTLVEEICVSKLKIAAYQSSCNPLRVKRIVENFDKEQLQPIDVSFRDGEYWIVDGQHRVEGIKELKIKTILCRIHYGLSYEQEAKLYVSLNSPTNRRTPTTIHRVNAMVEARDPKILEIKHLVESNNFIFGKDQSKTVDKIIAIATLEFIHKNLGVTGLDRVLRLVNKTWGGIFEAVDKHVLMGVYLFVKHYNNDFTDKEFISKMNKTHPREIITNGKSNKQFSLSAYTPYGIAIWYQYNKGRSFKLPNRFE